MLAETTLTASPAASPAVPVAPTMNFLAPQRALMERFFPGLDAKLAAMSERSPLPSFALLRNQGPIVHSRPACL